MSFAIPTHLCKHIHQAYQQQIRGLQIPVHDVLGVEESHGVEERLPVLQDPALARGVVAL
jgi:hypothetical protein